MKMVPLPLASVFAGAPRMAVVILTLLLDISLTLVWAASPKLLASQPIVVPGKLDQQKSHTDSILLNLLKTRFTGHPQDRVELLNELSLRLNLLRVRPNVTSAHSPLQTDLRDATYIRPMSPETVTKRLAGPKYGELLAQAAGPNIAKYYGKYTGKNARDILQSTTNEKPLVPSITGLSPFIRDLFPSESAFLRHNRMQFMNDRLADRSRATDLNLPSSYKSNDAFYKHVHPRTGDMITPKPTLKGRMKTLFLGGSFGDFILDEDEETAINKPHASKGKPIPNQLVDSWGANKLPLSGRKHRNGVTANAKPPVYPGLIWVKPQATDTKSAWRDKEGLTEHHSKSREIPNELLRDLSTSSSSALEPSSVQNSRSPNKDDTYLSGDVDISNHVPDEFGDWVDSLGDAEVQSVPDDGGDSRGVGSVGFHGSTAPFDPLQTGAIGFQHEPAPEETFTELGPLDTDTVALQEEPEAAALPGQVRDVSNSKIDDPRQGGFIAGTMLTESALADLMGFDRDSVATDTSHLGWDGIHDPVDTETSVDDDSESWDRFGDFLDLPNDYDYDDETSLDDPWADEIWHGAPLPNEDLGADVSTWPSDDYGGSLNWPAPVSSDSEGEEVRSPDIPLTPARTDRLNRYPDVHSSSR